MVTIKAGAAAHGQIEAVLGCSAEVASITIETAPGALNTTDLLRPLVERGQRAGAAMLVADDAKLCRLIKADGVHLSAGAGEHEYREVRQSLGSGSIVGADAGRSRDAAMRLGEAGADYIGFGIPDFVTDRAGVAERRLDLVQWWAELFEVPCVALDVEDAETAGALMQAGAEFVALRLAPEANASAVIEVTRAVRTAIAGRRAGNA
jgi:thiamine-phosphate pyrophosphorylase